MLFDDDNVYVAAAAGRRSPSGWSPTRCGATAANIVGRTSDIGFTFDTFYDRRNGVSFTVNPLGGRTDGQITERAAVQRRLEPGLGGRGRAASRAAGRSRAAIPFKSLRYRPGRAQVWGFNVSRHNHWKNEIVLS